jgi:hypothetical protein
MVFNQTNNNAGDVINDRDDEVFALYKALEWAMETAVQPITEKGETAAGLFCIHCQVIVKPENRKGLVTDPVTHKSSCPYRAAKCLLNRYR